MSLANMLITKLDDLKYVESATARFFGKIYLPYLGWAENTQIGQMLRFFLIFQNKLSLFFAESDLR